MGQLPLPEPPLPLPPEPPLPPLPDELSLAVLSAHWSLVCVALSLPSLLSETSAMFVPDWVLPWSIVTSMLPEPLLLGSSLVSSLPVSAEPLSLLSLLPLLFMTVALLVPDCVLLWSTVAPPPPEPLPEPVPVPPMLPPMVTLAVFAASCMLLWVIEMLPPEPPLPEPLPLVTLAVLEAFWVLLCVTDVPLLEPAEPEPPEPEPPEPEPPLPLLPFETVALLLAVCVLVWLTVVLPLLAPPEPEPLPPLPPEPVPLLPFVMVALLLAVWLLLWVIVVPPLPPLPPPGPWACTMGLFDPTKASPREATAVMAIIVKRLVRLDRLPCCLNCIVILFLCNSCRQGNFPEVPAALLGAPSFRFFLADVSLNTQW